MLSERSNRNIDFLDGLRGFAILLVVIFHFWQISWLNHSVHVSFIDFDLNFIARSGFVGVELFFFLSGFCLFLPHAHFVSVGKPLASLSSFTYKRLIKILPSYFLCIFLVIWINEVEFQSLYVFLKVLVAHIFFSTNILTEFNVVNGVFWSLAVEVQFYVIFPFLAVFFRRNPYVLFLLICTVAVSFRYYFLINDAKKLSYMMQQMPASLDLFACGMLGAYFFVKFKPYVEQNPHLKYFLSLISIISVVLFFELLRWYVDALSYGGGASEWLVFHRLSLGLIFLCMTCSGVFAIRFWVNIVANRFFVFLGFISYNLYIWHQLIALYLYKNKIVMPSVESPRDDFVWQLTFTVVISLVSILFTSLITFYFERPLMRNGIKGSMSLLMKRVGLNRKAG